MIRLQEFTRRQIIILSVLVVIILSIVVGSLYLSHKYHSYPQELVAVDSLCEDKPDSAALILNWLSKKKYSSEADRMYYKLLCIKSSNNMYQPQKDSTIFQVVDYFDDMGDKKKLCEAYYYLGKYYREHYDAPQELKSFQRALDLSDDKTPLVLLSKIYNQSGRIFHEQDLYDKALMMFRKSLVLDSIQGDSVNMVYGMRDIAQTYKYKNELDSSLYYYTKAYELSKKVGDELLTNSVLLPMASLYKSKGDVSSAHRYLSKVLQNICDNIKSPAYSLAAEIFKKERKVDSVYYYCRELLSIGTIYAREYATGELYEYFAMKGDVGNALTYMRINRMLADSISEIDATQSVAKMHSLYNYSLREQENNVLKEKNQERVIAFMLISFVLVSFLLFSLYINEHNKKKILKYELINAHLEELSNASRAEIESYKVRIQQMSQELDNVSFKLEENNKEKSFRKLQVYEMIKKCISDKKGISEKNWSQIENAIDIIYPDFKKELMYLSNLNTHEYHVCILVKLNFSNSDIAAIMCRTTGTISFTRSMLYKKLLHKEGKAQDFDKFISSF